MLSRRLIYTRQITQLAWANYVFKSQLCQLSYDTTTHAFSIIFGVNSASVTVAPCDYGKLSLMVRWSGDPSQHVGQSPNLPISVFGNAYAEYPNTASGPKPSASFTSSYYDGNQNVLVIANGVGVERNTTTNCTIRNMHTGASISADNLSFVSMPGVGPVSLSANTITSGSPFTLYNYTLSPSPLYFDISQFLNTLNSNYATVYNYYISVGSTQSYNYTVTFGKIIGVRGSVCYFTATVNVNETLNMPGGYQFSESGKFYCVFAIDSSGLKTVSSSETLTASYQPPFYNLKSFSTAILLRDRFAMVTIIGTEGTIYTPTAQNTVSFYSLSNMQLISTSAPIPGYWTDLIVHSGLKIAWLPNVNTASGTSDILLAYYYTGASFVNNGFICYASLDFGVTWTLVAIPNESGLLNTSNTDLTLTLIPLCSQ